jgi:hypothetical protein
MDHYQVEKDIQHLEQIINHIAANDPLPLSYWRNRVQTVAAAAIVPAQRGRVNRLIEVLEALEAHSKASRAQGTDGAPGALQEPEGS